MNQEPVMFKPNASTRMFRVYLLGIFPADVPVNKYTGEILDNPQMTNHWLNHERLQWFFDTLATIQAFCWAVMGAEKYLFPMDISRNDKRWMKENKITLWSQNRGGIDDDI